jgi:HEPN domain-containing protein
MAKPVSKIDPLKTFMNAERFRISDRHLRSVGDLQLLNVMGTPAMVMGTFAIELYLKCILLLEKGAASDTHHLQALYRDISEETKAKLVALWKAEVPKQEPFWAEIEKQSGSKFSRELNETLKDGSRAFTELRYLHEKDKPDCSFRLTNFPEMLRQVIVEMKPEWAKLRHSPPAPHPTGVD